MHVNLLNTEFIVIFSNVELKLLFSVLPGMHPNRIVLFFEDCELQNHRSNFRASGLLSFQKINIIAKPFIGELVIFDLKCVFSKHHVTGSVAACSNIRIHKFVYVTFCCALEL